MFGAQTRWMTIVTLTKSVERLIGTITKFGGPVSQSCRLNLMQMILRHLNHRLQSSGSTQSLFWSRLPVHLSQPPLLYQMQVRHRQLVSRQPTKTLHHLCQDTSISHVLMSIITSLRQQISSSTIGTMALTFMCISRSPTFSSRLTFVTLESTPTTRTVVNSWWFSKITMVMYPNAQSKPP